MTLHLRIPVGESLIETRTYGGNMPREAEEKLAFVVEVSPAFLSSGIYATVTHN